MDNYTPENTNEAEVVTEPEVTVETVEEKKPFPVLGLISMICGIVAILLACCCAVAGAILGIAAVVLAIVERSKTGKFSGFALAGLICGGVGVVIGIVNGILGAIGGAALGSGMDDFYDDYYYYY